jgi:hypothetical protein
MTLPSRLSPPLRIAKGYAYGVARDEVTSVAFTVAGGGRVTVPVQHNLFIYESEPSNSHRSIGDISVRFADGTVEPVG